MQNKFRKILKEISPRWRTRKVKSYPEVYNWLISTYPNVDLNIAIDSVVHGVSPYCVVCNNPIKTLGKKTCSNKCGSKTVDHTLKNQKRKQTISKDPSILENAHKKRIDTLEKKYGAKVSPNTRQKAKERASELNSKGRKTLKEKYGVLNPGQLKDHREKCKKTLKENYGVDNYFKSETFKSQRLETKKSRYENSVDSVDIIKVFDPIELTQYKNPNLRISFKCKKCNNEETLPSETWKWRSREFGDPCAKCNNLLNGSRQEQQVREFINNILGIRTVNNYKLPNRKEIDIYIPELNIGFEYNGLYWHNDTRIDQNYHLDKSDFCAQQGIQLFHIFEDEWVNTPEIVKSRIRFILGKTTQKIYARKCIVKEIDSKTANQFLQDNHLQGVGRSNVRLGLYYNDTLISVMTFLKGDISKKLNGWELNRFCSQTNTSVIGAAGKLFSYFMKHYNPESITSFSDRRWSLHTPIYKSLGFDFSHNTVPNYWYFTPKETKRIHRYSLRKDPKSKLTERELRQSQGYLRIYDCGSSKWVWRRKKAE